MNVCKEGECKTWVLLADKMCTEAVSFVSTCILHDTLKRALVQQLPGITATAALGWVVGGI